ncbi:MAG: hypothetical protein NTV23_09945 [Propionibacteriales bacterium]|nr:hypothetical protein [Propionibacteriales bacterium]
MRVAGRVGGLSFGWVVVILQVGTWFAISTAEPGWLGSWRQAIDNAVGTVSITGPLLAGLVAGSYASLRGTSLADLVQVSARPWRGWFGPALRLWAASVIGLVTLLAALTVRAQLLEVPTPPRQFLVVPLGLLVLGVHALVGLVLGLRASPRVAPVLAAGTSFGLFLLANSHLAPPSFITGGVTGSMYGEQYRLGSVLVLCVFAVASGAVLAPWAGCSKAFPWVRWMVTAASVAVIIGLAQKAWPDVESRLEAGPISFRCEQGTVEICVVRERPSKDLHELAARLETLAAPLRGLGLAVPTRWKYLLVGHRVDPGWGVLILEGRGARGGRVDDADLLRSLARPASCPEVPAEDEPPSVYVSRALVAGWLAQQNGMRAMVTFRPGYPAKKAEAWIRTTYDQLRRCDLDAIRRP